MKAVLVYFGIIILVVTLLTIIGFSLELPYIVILGVNIGVITLIRNRYFTKYFK